MAIGTTYTKTKNFFVARTTACARPLFRPGLYRSCLFVRGRAFSRRPDFLRAFVFRTLPAPPLSVPESLLMRTLPLYTDHDYVKRILKAKENVVSYDKPQHFKLI